MQQAAGQAQMRSSRVAPSAPSRPLLVRRRRPQTAVHFRRPSSSVASRPAAPHQQSQHAPRQSHAGRHQAPAPGSLRTKTGKRVFAPSRKVKFHVRYKCEWGQEVYLVGNCSALGDWDVTRGVQLVWSVGHVWEGSVELPAGTHVQYKYVVRNRDGSVVRWQEGANVCLDLPGANAEALALDVEDSWNKSKQVKRMLAAGTPVRFNIRRKVEFGQQLLVVGSCASLGAWNVDGGVRLTWQEGHIWEASVELPAGELVQYKYVVLSTSGDGVDCWQPGDNLQMEVPVAQANNGRRRGVLVLDTWAKASSKAAKRAARPQQAQQQQQAQAQAHQQQAPRSGSWRSTPYASVPASSTADIADASSAMAARSYYSMMPPASQPSSDAASGIYDPQLSHQPDPNVLQLWTDKPRFGNAAPAPSQQHAAHRDAWGQAQQQQQQEAAAQPPRAAAPPPPPAGTTGEELARWQALQSVMAALQHSAELDHWVDDPTDPRMLAADRRLAALTASLGTSTGAGMATAMA